MLDASSRRRRESETLTGYRIKATAAGGFIRATGAATTDIARQAQSAHHASPLAAAAMGRLMTGALLLASGLKQGERVHCEIAGGGPAGRVMAEAWAAQARGRIDHPDVDLPLTPAGKLAVGQAIGQDGWFIVRRNLSPDSSYTSYVAIETGEIGDELAAYLRQSDQVPSAVAVGVLIGRDGWVEASGGILVQAMPPAEADLVAEVERRFKGLARLSQRLAAGESVEALLASVLPGPVHWAPAEPIFLGCTCSREHSAELVRTLPADEILARAHESGVEVICHYCRTAYRFDARELMAPAIPSDGRDPI